MEDEEREWEQEQERECWGEGREREMEWRSYRGGMDAYWAKNEEQAITCFLHYFLISYSLS